MDIGVAFIVNQLKDLAPIKVISKTIKGVRKLGITRIMVICLREQHKEDIPNYFPENIEYISLNNSFMTLEIQSKKVSTHIYNILTTHNISIIHSHSYQADIISSYLPSNIKKISTQHNIAIEDFTLSKGKTLGYWMSKRLLFSLKKFDYIIGVSKIVEEYCKKHIKKDKPVISHIYNDISLPKYNDIKVTRKTKKLIFCGTLTKRKDPLLLLEAFTELLRDNEIPKYTTLEILGEGYLLERAKEIANGYNENIFFKGFRTDAIEIMKDCDIFVSCSKSEGLGLSLIEAIAIGLVPICTDILAFREIIGEDKIANDLKFTVGDKHSLKNSIIKAINTNPTNELKNDIINRFSIGNMAIKYFDLYQSIQ